ncbi:MAG TPA: 16S rRNA processing protein RimM [Thermoanaerobacterales bacterium]|nr:16S rRNA processing protein RimM [Thermoanaerobacterales bacterium]
MDYLIIGKTISAHGNKGEVKVMPLTDDITRFKRLNYVYLDIRNELKPFKIENVWYHKNNVIIKFAGIDSIEDAENIKDFYLKIKREDAIELPPGHFFIFELIGCQVFTIDGYYLGKVNDVMKTGSNDVYVVENENKQIYIPAIKDVVKEVDVKNKLVKIKLIEGLI